MGISRWAALATFGAVTLGAAQSPTPESASSLFSSDTPLHVRIEAPLHTLFAARKDSTQEVVGTLTYTDEGGRPIAVPNVTFSLRGNTSLQEGECTFPKLKARFPKGQLPAGSTFRGLKTVKIGTHCGERPDTERTPKGRLANQKAAPREAFVYRLLDSVGVVSLKARPAEITYVDGGQTLVRHALFLEDMNTALTRLGADREIDKMQFTNAGEMFDPADGAKLAFAEALVGNFDWCVKWTADDMYRCDARQILWNVAALGRPGGRALPLAYDFDVSGMVTGGHGWFPRVFDEAFSPSRSRPEVEVLAQVQRARSLFPRVTLDATRRSFLAHKADAFRVLDQSNVDAAGKNTIHAYMAAFFDAIDNDAAFYRPIVITPNSVVAYADAARTRQACPVTVPPGTPVAEAGDAAGGVRLLDALWQWSMNKSCDAMRSGPVWIDRQAIGTNYPAQ